MRNNIYPVALYLGGLYTVSGRLVRFIKVTDKGFNFLDEDTNKCVLKKHLYSRKHYGLPLPKDIKQVHTYMTNRPNYMGQAI